MSKVKVIIAIIAIVLALVALTYSTITYNRVSEIYGNIQESEILPTR